MGYYEVSSRGLDRRANNITNPAVKCGSVLGAPLQNPKDSLSPSTYSGVETNQRNLYVCASGVRAAIKTVDFRYNGTERRFSNLAVLRIKDKVYHDEESKPLWAVEHSYDERMSFEPLWGIVDGRYETTDGFYTLRADKLWLPTNPHLTINFGESEVMDALAAVTGFIRRLGNLYDGLASLKERDYTGEYEYALFERFQRLSHNETVASQIPSLILNDKLAAGLVGTKTSISIKYVVMPASLAANDTVRGFPRARVMTYGRVLRYDMRYAIPALAALSPNVHPLYLPAHATHKLQPLDVGPFSPLSSAYSRAVEEYTPTGITTLNRSIFTVLYVRTRQEAFTERNIRAGWRRAGIWPINKQKLLDDPEIQNFGRTTPEYQPAPIKEGPNHLYSTLKKLNEIQELQAQIEAKVTPRTRRSVRKLGHAAIQEHTGAQLLQNELNNVRKQIHHQEVKKRLKRMLKERVQRSWNLEEVRAAKEGRAPSRVQITHRSEDSLRIRILSDRLK
jgi:hypothetical protein